MRIYTMNALAAYNPSLTDNSLLPLNSGEAPVDHAPAVRLRGGASCIPQHYLRYNHTRQSVEALVMDMDYDPNYLIFVSENAGGVYIQIGIAGLDNYKSAHNQQGRKIVFGRLWRVEPTLPTSEVIQTVFLAIKKAREHEIRELFTITVGGLKTTPLSNHHDLPLMARRSEDLAPQPQTVTLKETIDSVRFDGGRFEITDAMLRNSGQLILDLTFVPATGRTRADMAEPITLLLRDSEPNTVYHALMKYCLDGSDAHVDENFTFKGFARFSRNVDILAIADMSAQVRAKPKNSVFSKTIKATNYETDAGRVPVLSDSAYADKIKSDIAKLDIRAGFLPQ